MKVLRNSEGIFRDISVEILESIPKVVLENFFVGILGKNSEGNLEGSSGGIHGAFYWKSLEKQSKSPRAFLKESLVKFFKKNLKELLKLSLCNF